VSILQNRVLVPIEVDEQGNILDGHHRFRICEEEGIREYPFIIRAGLTEEQKRAHVLTLNHDRRHLTAEERDELLRADREAGMSLRMVAEKHGVSHQTVANAAAGVKSLTPDAKVKGKDGKSYPARRPSVMATTKAQASKALEALRDVPAGQLPQKVLTTNRVARIAREYQAGLRAEEAKGDVRIGKATLLLGDLWGETGRQYDVPADSVDLIFTDPPYERQSLTSYEALALMAARVLKSGGLLATYCGCLYLSDIFDAFRVEAESDGDPRCQLEYLWTAALILPGQHSRVHAVSVAQGWKPIVFFRKHNWDDEKDRGSLLWAEDTFQSEGLQKDGHDWQQSLGCAAYYIGKLLPRGGTVLDPFLGAGTTGRAALDCGCDFIGIEVDPKAFAVAQERLQA